MSWWKAFWAACVAAVLGLAYWHNSRLYPRRSRLWRAGKALIDGSLVLALAFRLPVLLCAYVILWFTKPLSHRPVLRTTVGALIGIAVAFASGFMLELVVIAGIFAIDMVTGAVWKYWHGIGTEEINWKAELFGRTWQPTRAAA